MQSQRLASSEKAKKLMEDLESLYKRIKELMEQKKKLVEEYQERLKEIESQIVESFIEAGRILERLEKEEGISPREVQILLPSIPKTFFENALKVYRKNLPKPAISTAVEKAYKELAREEEPHSPAILRVLKTVSATPTSESRAFGKLERPRLEEEKATFICPLCQEEHDRDTELVTMQVCRLCRTFIEQYIISMGVFKNHGVVFVKQWKNTADVYKKYLKLKNSYKNLLGYLKSLNVAVPKEFQTVLSEVESA